LSRRISRGPLLASPRATRDYLRLRFADLQHEVFCLLYLDLCGGDGYVESLTGTAEIA
jgi:DNA repair protein RadC